MLMRLQKYLASCGVASRRHSEDLIKEGRVMVNGTRAKLGQSIDPKLDQVKIGKKIISLPPSFSYFLFYKPRSVVSTITDPEGRVTVSSFFPPNQHLHPVGRLDYDSEGLMLLTNDGELTQRLTHPKYQVQKTYQVLVNGTLTNSDLTKLQNGIYLKDLKLKTKRATVRLIESNNNRSLFEITIHEGKNRQIRRMCEALGYQVARLIRTRLDNWTIGDLKPGEYTQIQLDS